MTKDIFTAECARIASIAKIYRDSVKRHYDQSCAKIVRYQYANGGQLLHRGFFCPSLIFDIVNGNVKRGKLLKRLASKTPKFKFGFDSNDQLVAIERPFSKEFIIHQEEYEFAVTFNDMPSGRDMESHIELIAECQFHENGKLRSYSTYLMEETGEEVFELNREEYTYYDDKLIVECVRFLNTSDPLLSRVRFDFSIQNGSLVDYTVKEYNDMIGQNTPQVERIFKVMVDRKV